MAIEKLYTQEEAALVLGIAAATLRRWRSNPPEGRPVPRYIKIGGRVRYQESELKKFIEQGRRGAA